MAGTCRIGSCERWIYLGPKEEKGNPRHLDGVAVTNYAFVFPEKNVSHLGRNKQSHKIMLPEFVSF